MAEILTRKSQFTFIYEVYVALIFFITAETWFWRLEIFGVLSVA